MQIGKYEFQTEGHTYIMGILNVTPDSFSDGGKWNQREAALHRVEQMLREGADLIDVGGESTRPGYKVVSDEEEIERVLPIIEGIKAEFDVPVSLDTYKSKVAKAGLLAGADMINDIWGLKYDDKMAEIVAGSGAAYCLMHNRENAVYTDFLQEVKADLQESLMLANRAGIARDKIILDPGVGFAKSYEQNLQILHHLEQFKEAGYPVLLGCSRKSVIGLSLDLPSDERMEGTLATTVMAVLKGCMFVRVHDIKENYRAIKMTETVLNGGRE